MEQLVAFLNSSRHEYLLFEFTAVSYVKMQQMVVKLNFLTSQVATGQDIRQWLSREESSKIYSSKYVLLAGNICVLVIHW